MPRSRSTRREVSNRVSSPISSYSRATRSKRRTKSRRCGSNPRGLAGTGCTPSHRDLESWSAACARGLSPQCAVQAAPNLAVLSELVLVVVHLGPRLECRLRLRVELARGRAAVDPENRQVGLDLPHNLRLEEDDILRIFAVQQGEIVHIEDPDELLDRGRMIVDADVDPAVVDARISTAVTDHEHRRALLAPLVSAGSLPGAQRRQETDGEVALCHLERPGQRLQDVLARKDVPLGREIPSDDVPRPREAFFPGIRRGAASRVDDAELALRRVFV